MLLYRNIRNRRELVLICFCLNNMIRFKCRLIFIQYIVKNKKIFLLLPLLVILTLVFSFFFSKKVKTEVNSQEEMYYNITQNPAFPKVNGNIYDMALNADGSILYVGGEFSHIGDFYGLGAVYSRTNLAAIKTSDFSVTSWAPAPDYSVKTIEVYGDSIYIGGSFTHIGETYTGEFARINSDGTLDSSCLPNIYTDFGPRSTVYDVEVNSQYIYVGGSFNRIIDSSNTVYGLVRLNRSDCSWDSGFVPVLDGTVYDIELYDGGIYIGGRFKNIGVTYTGDFAKLNSDGSVNLNCTPNIHTLEEIETVYDISLTDEFIYVGGSFNSIGEGEYNVNGLIRLYNTNTCSWDNSWVPEVSNGRNRPVIFSISPVRDDVFVGGSFTSIGGLSNTEFSLLDGTSGDSLYYWNPEIGGSSGYGLRTVYSSLVRDNKVYVGGSFTHVFGEGSFGYGLASFSFSYDVVPTIQVNTIEDLDNMRENLFANYVLTKDLDFENCNSYQNCDNMSTYTQGLGWEPIGYLDEDSEIEYPFYGTFDGQGYEISNLYINRAEPSGLFGLNYGTIKDLKVVDVNIELLAEAEEMTAVGAIVANNHGTISNCYASGQVSGEEFVGGLVGYQGGATIENSSSSVSVTGLGEVGGLVGASEASTISNSYATGDVTGVSFVGGLAGYSNDSISNSFSIGLVTASSYFGGLVGEGIPEFTEYSYWDTETSGVETSGSGIGLTTIEMKTLLSFSDWDIVAMNSFDPSDPSIWYISDGQDYPRLYWEYEAPEVLTKTATDITIESATLNGELISMDGETEVGVYFRYRQGDEGAWITVDGVTKTSSGVFSSPITGLTLNTQYQYQAVVTWRGVGTEYGNIVTFTTPETPPLPTVFGTVVSNIDDIQTPTSTEAPLVLTKIGTGSITFPSGLNLVDNYEQLSNLSENLVILYEPSTNRFRAYVNSNGASFLASHGATIRFFNVRNQLGISGLTSSNFKTLLKVSVLNDSKSVVTDTSSYFDWNNASYNQDTDILTMPVNHFSEYVLGVNTGVLPSTGMSSLTMLIPLGLSLIGVGVILFSKKRYKKI